MRTLLLADDSVTTQRVIALTFSDESFRVVTVSDGQQAIDSMAVVRPDIVLAGTTLPRLNGYELAEHMRGVETLKAVPVLLLSGAFESVDAARLKASGARGVIEKPLEPTAVISRVKELLGLRDARPAPPRSAAPPAPPTAAVSSWDELRQGTGLGPDARSVEGGTAGSGREDYLDTLDTAFDSLDQHLAGRRHDAQPQHRNPSPPLGQASGAPDPRSPGRRPSSADGSAPNSVFEVDNDWFAADNRTSGDLAAQREMVVDAHEAMPPRPTAAPGGAVFEVDDEWFAGDDKAREQRRAEQRDLAAEMGIHDVELPEAGPALNKPAPADGLDFDFGLDDLALQAQAPQPVALAPMPPAPLAPAPAPAPVVPVVPVAPILHVVAASSPVADDFAALLAFEIGDAVPHLEPPPAATPAAPAMAPVVVQAVAPEITGAMLDQIAERVADRLNAGAFGPHLREAMTATVRDTVRSVVSETSERLVRDEIARVKARAERDTQ